MTMTDPAPEANVMREAIFAGLTAFCSNQPDFDMSSGMKRAAADYILGQPGMYVCDDIVTRASTPSASAGEVIEAAFREALEIGYQCGRANEPVDPRAWETSDASAALARPSEGEDR